MDTLRLKYDIGFTTFLLVLMTAFMLTSCGDHNDRSSVLLYTEDLAKGQELCSKLNAPVDSLRVSGSEKLVGCGIKCVADAGYESTFTFQCGGGEFTYSVLHPNKK